MMERSQKENHDRTFRSQNSALTASIYASENLTAIHHQDENVMRIDKSLCKG
uniref:Uncharacterized protein n=1 Tax=Setaria italica TaxID=4555 RepID=K4AHZ9_SETIT